MCMEAHAICKEHEMGCKLHRVCSFHLSLGLVLSVNAVKLRTHP